MYNSIKVIYINKETVIYVFKEKGGYHERIKGNPPSRVMSIQNDKNWEQRIYKKVRQE